MIDLGHMIAAIHDGASFFLCAVLDDRLVGKWIFASLFGILVLWLFFIPRARIGQHDAIPRWWRNVRFWAIIVATIQCIVYAIWG